MKRTISIILVIVTLVSLLTISSIPASAASSGTYTVTATTEKYYTIFNLGSGKMLNVYGSKNANNTNVTVYSNDRTNGQQWKAVSYNGNYYFVPKCATGRALNVYGSSSKEGSNVCLWSQTKSSTQLWKLEYSTSPTGVIIRSVNSPQYVLTANGSSNSSNVCLKKYSAGNAYQVWTSDIFNITFSRNNSTTVNQSFIKKNILQVSAKSSDKYLSGEWFKLKNGDCSCCNGKYSSKYGEHEYIQGGGCAIVSLVSAVYNLGGTISDSNVYNAVSRVFNWGYQKGYWRNGLKDSNFFVNSKNEFGKEYGFTISSTYNRTVDNTLISHLQSGGTAVVHCCGHYMAVVAYRNDNGVAEILVFDPAPGNNTNWNSLKRQGITRPEGDWISVADLKNDGGTKGKSGSGSSKAQRLENIEIDQYWLVSRN